MQYQTITKTQNIKKMSNKKAAKKARFDELMTKVNKNYEIGSVKYVDTLDGKVTATVVEYNPSKFLVSCSVVLDLGNGVYNTLMFTN